MPKIDLETLQKYRLQIVFVSIGLILIFGGIILQKRTGVTDSNIQVLDTPSTAIDSNTPQVSNIIVDIRGSVINPGIYHLNTTARIEDALIASGGLSVNADRNWVDKNIDRAAKLIVIDGQKIYIPGIQQSNSLIANNSSTTINVAHSYTTPDSTTININTASSSKLDSLVGIGQVYAQKIIEQRPYSDINELISKKVIPLATFNKIKNFISVY